MAEPIDLPRIRKHPFLVHARRHEQQGILLILGAVTILSALVVMVVALCFAIPGHYLVNGTATNGQAVIDWKP